MGHALHVTAAIALGALVALQPPINAAMARALGSPVLAATISITISLAFMLVVSLASGQDFGALAGVRKLPWWVVLGGIVGAIFVAGSVVLAPALGIALFFVCVVAGQMVGAALADHVGAFGTPVEPVSAMKLLGIGLVIAGAALVHNGGR